VEKEKYTKNFLINEASERFEHGSKETYITDVCIPLTRKGEILVAVQSKV